MKSEHTYKFISLLLLPYNISIVTLTFCALFFFVFFLFFFVWITNHRVRQEAEEQRIIEEAKAKEAARIENEINKMKKKFDNAIEQGNYKKLSKCLDEMESMVRVWVGCSFFLDSICC